MFVPFPLVLSQALYDRLDAMAQATGRNITTLVREAIEQRVSQFEDDQAREAFSAQHQAPGPDEAWKAFQRRRDASFARERRTP